MARILRSIVAMGILAVGLVLAGCTTESTLESTDPNSGVTDDPAVGFANFKSSDKEHFTMTAGRRVYFKKGSAELDDVARETLNLQAAWLVKNKKWLIKLQGHADDPGSEESNRQLSSKRANNVMNYLASRGVSPSRMWAKGYAKERLVRNCGDITCKSQNRRVISNLRTEFDAAAPQYKGNQS